MAKKKKRPKTDVSKLTTEAPVNNNKGRRYLLGAIKTVANLPLGTVLIGGRSQGSKALQQLRKLAQGFDLEKAQEVISLMKQYETNTDIQALGCATLASIAMAESTGLIQIGVVDAVLTSMEKHPKAERVQASACLLVWNLAVKKEHKELLASHRVDDLLVNAMVLHEKQQAVQHMATGAITILANLPEVQVRLAKKGVVELIMKAMKAFTSGNSNAPQSLTALTETFISAIQNFAFGAEFVGKLMKLGAGKLVIEAMEKYHDDAEIQTSGCGALWNLAIPTENKMELAEMGATEAILDALETFKDSEALVLNAVGALKNLLVLPANVELIAKDEDPSDAGKEISRVIAIVEGALLPHGEIVDINRITVEVLDILYHFRDGDDFMDDDEESQVNIDD